MSPLQFLVLPNFHSRVSNILNNYSHRSRDDLVEYLPSREAAKVNITIITETEVTFFLIKISDLMGNIQETVETDFLNFDGFIMQLNLMLVSQLLQDFLTAF